MVLYKMVSQNTCKVEREGERKGERKRVRGRKGGREEEREGERGGKERDILRKKSKRKKMFLERNRILV